MPAVPTAPAEPGRPYRNRVTPTGEIVAVAARGTMYGNRGVLHDRDLRVVRRWQVRRWLVCELSFRGRRRPLLRPGRYTELFLLDEAVALAAGHRPCAECRHRAYQDFRSAWTAVRDLPQPPSADGIDVVLHDERALDGGRRRTVPMSAPGLPDGVFVASAQGPRLVVQDGTRAWTPSGYGPWRPLPVHGTVPVLTPPSTVDVLRAGYRPRLHPTATP